MANTDSDATYCSQAELFSRTPSPRMQCDSSEFSNLRRSQRLSQQNRNAKQTMNKASPQKKSLRIHNQKTNSTQFCTYMEIDGCSKNAAAEINESQTKKPGTTEGVNLKNSRNISESIDLIAESETLSQELPLNQSLYQGKWSQNKFENAIDLTIRSNCNKANALDSINKNKDDIKFTTNFSNDVSNRGRKRTHHTPKEETSPPKSSGAPPSKMVPQDVKSEPAKSMNLETPNGRRLRPYSDVIPILQEEEKSKNRKEKQTRNKTKASSISGRSRKAPVAKAKQINRNLAVIYNDGKTDFSREMIEMNVNCPTRRGVCEPPPFRITKPLPLLRSVSKSLLPKVYPPHFANQKPPIESIENHGSNLSAKYSCPDFTAIAPASGGPCSTALYSLPLPGKYEKGDLHNFPNSSTKIKTNMSNGVNFLFHQEVPMKSNSNETQIVSGGIDDLEIFYPKVEYSEADDGRPKTFSPTLPESLKGVFDSDDLCEILGVEKIEYRLRESHVKALAVILNINVKNLRDVIQNIVTMDMDVLKKIESVKD